MAELSLIYQIIIMAAIVFVAIFWAEKILSWLKNKFPKFKNFMMSDRQRQMEALNLPKDWKHE